jgi:hypothetical protein
MALVRMCRGWPHPSCFWRAPSRRHSRARRPRTIPSRRRERSSTYVHALTRWQDPRRCRSSLTVARSCFRRVRNPLQLPDASTKDAQCRPEGRRQASSCFAGTMEFTRGISRRLILATLHLSEGTSLRASSARKAPSHESVYEVSLPSFLRSYLPDAANSPSGKGVSRFLCCGDDHSSASALSSVALMRTMFRSKWSAW